MSEVSEEKQDSTGQELRFSNGLSAAKSNGPGKSKRNFTLPVLALLALLLVVFTGLQAWGTSEFRRGIRRLEPEAQKLEERLKFLKDTAGGQNMALFFKAVNLLNMQCQRQVKEAETLKRKWWFVLPFLKGETVSQRLSNLQKELGKILSVSPTVEIFVNRLKETDDGVVRVMEALETDPEGMIVELASFVEDNEALRKDVERARWPAALEPYREIFLAALDAREAALVALLESLRAFSAASICADKAVSAYLSAWSIWDYQEALDYIESAEEYRSQAEGYIAEFEFHTARYVKLRDRLVGEPPSNRLPLYSPDG